jgi:hypothetical protein
VSWARHTKRGAPDAPPTLRIDYYCQPADEDLGNLTETKIQEWVCIEHVGFAATKAKAWWDAHSNEPMPDTVDETLTMLDGHQCRMPARITTQKDGRWNRIQSVEFDSERPEPEEYTQEAVIVDAFGEDDLPF